MLEQTIKNSTSHKILNYLILITIFTFTQTYALAQKPGETQESLNVIASTFPIYQITRNLTNGTSVRLSLLLPSNLGCPHDYTLTPNDLQKISQARALIINGLGMEEFSDKQIKQIKPTLVIIDSANGINDLIDDEYDSSHNHHSQSHKNPHLYLSPRMSARIAANIASQLAEITPQHAQILLSNLSIFVHSMNNLNTRVIELSKQLKNHKVAQPRGLFDYLARDIGLEIVAVLPHHSQETSAAYVISVIQKLKNSHAGAIFTESQYSQLAAQTISKETGIPMVTLDPITTGPEDAQLNYFENSMLKNIRIIENTLSSQQ